MREQPPQPLIELLQRIGLATGADVQSVYGRARRLARDLPLFESVWVDALAQARILTHYQAAELNMGRGEQLAVGPYVICEKLHDLGYGTSYRARHREDGGTAQLMIASAHDVDAAVAGLEAMRGQLGAIDTPAIAPIEQIGVIDSRVWATYPLVPGESAQHWMVHNGRFPPLAVLELARQIIHGLARLETVDVLHGDISTHNLMISSDGGATLAHSGLKAAVRRSEGFAHAQLRPDTYDYLAPERVASGGGPTPHSELWSLGSMCWHLVTGRALLKGATGLEKMRAGQTARFTDLARLAPDVPAPLATAIAACIQREPSARPESMARLAAMLGQPTREGRRTVAECITRSGRPRIGLSAATSVPRWRTHSSLWLAAATGCLAALAVVLWPQWQGRLPLTGLLRNVAFASHSDTSKPNRSDPSAQHNKPINRSSAAAKGSATPSFAEYEDLESEQGRPSPPDSRHERRPAAAGDEVVLPVGRPLQLKELRVREGQTVRGAGGGRPLIEVPPGGLRVTADNVSFVDVDFVPSPEGPPTLVKLHAQSASFQGCSFQGHGGSGGTQSAITWLDPPGLKDDPVRLQTGVLEMTDCCLRGVDVGVDCRSSGGLVLEINNTLHLGPGPLLRLSRCPAVDQPVVVSLAHVTLREVGGLLECRYDEMADPPGKISIHALDCVFSPATSRSLLSFNGAKDPAPVLRVLQWTGQGSVVTTGARLVSWRKPGGEPTDLSEEELSIAGLVRSEVEFAADAGDSPEDSRLVSWQVPLRSTEPPGIGEIRWRLPRLARR